MVKINLNNSDKLLVCLIYRSPSNGSQEYNKRLRDLLDEINSKGYSHILMMGDFNYPDIDWESWNSKGDSTETVEYRFIDKLQDNYLFQHILKPTRWRGSNKPSILDLIISNEENMVSNIEYSSPLGKSDHCVVTFNFNCYVNLKRTNKSKRIYNKGKYKDFNSKIREKDWSNILNPYNTVDSNWKTFLTELTAMENQYIPKRTIPNYGKKKNTFPIDQSTRDKIRQKNNLVRKITRNNDPKVRQEYNKIRNKVKSEVNKQRKKYEKDLSSQAKENPKVIWSYIKSKLKTREGIGELYIPIQTTLNHQKQMTIRKRQIYLWDAVFIFIQHLRYLI